MSTEHYHPETLSATIDRIAYAINLYYDYILVEEFPNNTFQLRSRERLEPGDDVEEIFTVKRVFETAYWIKCDRAAVDSCGPLLSRKTALSYEFCVTPSLYEQGKMIVNTQEADIDSLPQNMKEASEVLARFELNLLSVLVAKCRGRSLFNPICVATKETLTDAYGQKTANEMWIAGMEAI